jgi:hypothetical protein
MELILISLLWLNYEKKAEQTDLKNLQLGQKRGVCKVGFKKSMVHEEFNGIVKKPTALHQDNALRALRN